MSNAVVDEPRKEIGGDDELAPLRVESNGWLCGNRVLERPPLLLELRDVAAYRHEHFAIFSQRCLVAYRLAMAGDDDRLVRYGGNIRLGRLDHPVDVSAGRVVDERIYAVPIGVAAMENIRFPDRDRQIAVGVRRTVIFEMKRRSIQLQCFL